MMDEIFIFDFNFRLVEAVYLVEREFHLMK